MYQFILQVAIFLCSRVKFMSFLIFELIFWEIIYIYIYILLNTQTD